MREKPRVPALDALRGLIVVLMALDHANHFVAQAHSPGEYWGGAFPAYRAALPFLTRLATHLCAPGFCFLMGVGLELLVRSRSRGGWSRWDIRRHFLIRGGLLIALQLLIVNRAWEISSGGWSPETYIGVLFALGGSMVLTGTLLLWLDSKVLLSLVITLVLAVELLTPQPDAWHRAFHPLTRLLLLPGGTPQLWVNYPILPWLPPVLLGVIFGRWLSEAPPIAFKRALKLGAVSLSAFLVLRYLDGFGNIRPRAGDTWIDFLNLVKYPPSVTFTLLTLGVNLIILGLFAQVGEGLSQFLRPLIVFGRVPLFFYVVHLFLYAGLGLGLTPDGANLPTMYLTWLLGLALLYPLCAWYGRLKHRQPVNSILRLL